MYTSGEYRQRLSASEKPVPDTGTQPLNVFKGKQRQRSVQFDESRMPTAAEHPMTPTSSPTPKARDTTLSLAVDVPIHLSNSPTSPESAARAYKGSPRFLDGYMPSLPPVPPSPRTPRHQPSQSDPTSFRLQPPQDTQAGRRRISAPLFPVVSDVRMHVERDLSEARPAFQFEMRFRVTLCDREMPQ